MDAETIDQAHGRIAGLTRERDSARRERDALLALVIRRIRIARGPGGPHEVFEVVVMPGLFEGRTFDDWSSAVAEVLAEAVAMAAEEEIA